MAGDARALAVARAAAAAAAAAQALPSRIALGSERGGAAAVGKLVIELGWYGSELWLGGIGGWERDRGCSRVGGLERI
jgi:hypothetical protein